jgi:amidase
MEVISGPSPNDPFTFPVVLKDYRTVDVRGLRVACWERVETTVPTAETREVIRRVAQWLTGTVAAVTDEQPAHLEKVCDIVHGFGSEVFVDMFPRLLRQYGHPESDPLTRQVVDFYREYLAQTPPESLEQAKTQWITLVRTSILAFLEQHDVIVTPVCSQPAMGHGTTNATRENLNGFFWTWLFSLVPGIPAGVVRCGTSQDGLPIGVQVAAKPYREDLVLAVMKQLEDAFGGYSPPQL